MKPAKIACNEIEIHHHIIAAPHSHRNAGDLRPGYLQPSRGHCHDQRLHLRAVCRSIIGDDLCRELVFQILCQLALEAVAGPRRGYRCSQDCSKKEKRWYRSWSVAKSQPHELGIDHPVKRLFPSRYIKPKFIHLPRAICSRVDLALHLDLATDLDCTVDQALSLKAPFIHDRNRHHASLRGNDRIFPLPARCHCPSLRAWSYR